MGDWLLHQKSQISIPRLLEEKYQFKFFKFNHKEGHRLLGIKAEHKVRKKRHMGRAGGAREAGRGAREGLQGGNRGS